jgi:8-oxo-dGTP pyrophosphatase MutT (NUDIX family)
MGEGAETLREQIGVLIAAIEPYDALEAEHRAFALEWVASGAPLFRESKPATPEPHLVSYFPVVDLGAGQVLLVDHRNSGLWLPAGGHVEPGEHPRATLEREVREELGIAAEPLVAEPLFITVTETVGPSPSHTDVSLWYVLAGDAAREVHFDAREFCGVRWFSLRDVPRERAEPHLERFVRKLAQCGVRGARG